MPVTPNEMSEQKKTFSNSTLNRSENLKIWKSIAIKWIWKSIQAKSVAGKTKSMLCVSRYYFTLLKKKLGNEIIEDVKKKLS